MYGCEYGMIKQKYSENWFFPIQIPKAILSTYRTEFEKFREIDERRLSFPKNSALTNVELHHWEDMKIRMSLLNFSVSLKDKIMKSHYTDWDNRYGIYLDDGWFYVYRSHILLNRFQLYSEDGKNYNIHHLQKSEAEQAGEISFEEAIYSERFHFLD